MFMEPSLTPNSNLVIANPEHINSANMQNALLEMKGLILLICTQYCQAQTTPRLQLNWTELALISFYTAPRRKTKKNKQKHISTPFNPKPT